MAYQFLQVIGLEKPADLRRARRALLVDGADFDCWVDPLDQVAWLHRPGEAISEDQTAAAVDRLKRAGFWAEPVDQRKIAGPACIARHRERRGRELRQRMIIALSFGLPVIVLHLFGYQLCENPRRELWPLWMQFILTAWVLFAASANWFVHGFRSILHGHWRWRTSLAAVLLGCLLLGAIDLLARSFGGDGMLPGLIGPEADNPHRSLFAPAVLVLFLWLGRAYLLRAQLERISQPFDRWLAGMTDRDETHLRYFLRVQARHQRTGLDLSWGRLADRFPDYGLAVATVALVVAWGASGMLVEAWALTAGLLLLLDPRSFQFTWMAPEVLAERQAAARGIYFADPRVFRNIGGVNAVVFEKTGTLTTGETALAAIEVNPLAALDVDENELLRLAASVEQGSTHALARGLLAEAQNRGLALSPVKSPQVSSGLGVSANIDGRRVRVGSERYFKEQGLDAGELEQTIARLKRGGLSVILVGVEDRIAGAIGEEDRVRPGSQQTVSQLQDDGLSVRLITGDSQAAGAAMAAALGVKQAAVELSPDGKLTQLDRWSEQGDRLAVVGLAGRHDRVIDAGEVGLAFFGSGEEAERRLADVMDVSEVGLGEVEDLTGAHVVLLGDTLEQTPAALRLARRVHRQRSRGFSWMVTLTALSAVVCVALPTFRSLAEWTPAIMAALALAGLPVILTGMQIDE